MEEQTMSETRICANCGAEYPIDEMFQAENDWLCEDCTDRLTVISAGREIHYAYSDLLKVNFDFAREPNATHVMEVMDKTYRYRLFYIGRVPRTQLNEIAERLRQTGIDATCSLNDEKRHYHDVYHG